MKALIIIFYLLLAVTNGLAYNATQDVNTNYASTYSTDPQDVIIRNNTLDTTTPVSVVGKPTSAEKTAATKQNESLKAYLASKEFVSKTNQNSYFLKNFNYDDAGLYCPPLAAEYKAAYGVLIESVNVFNGEISCSVYEKEFHQNQELTDAISKKIFKKVYTKTFSNPNYQKRIKVTDEDIMPGKSNLIDPGAIEAAKLYQDKLNTAKQQIKYRYQNIATSVNKQTYLDLSDVIDAVFTLDTSIVDVEQSLQTKTLTFQPGYRANYAEATVYETAAKVKALLNAGTKELNQKFDWFPIVYEKNSTSSIEQKQADAVVLLGSSINGVLYFIIKYNEYFDDIFSLFLILVIASMMYSVAHFYTENYKHLGDPAGKKYLLTKTIFVGVSAFILMTFSLTNKDFSFELDGKTITVSTNKFQSYTTTMAGSLNDTADLLTEAVIDSYANNLFSGVAMSATSIKSTAKTFLKYEKIKDINTQVVNDCIDIYNIDLLRSEYSDFYSKIKGSNLFIPEALAQKGRTQSVYNTINLGGFIADKTKFDEKGLTLNACFNARKDLTTVGRKLDYMNSKLDAFNNLTMQEVIYEQKEFILDKLYNDYYKYGYMAVANINIIDAYRKIMELPMKKADDWSNILLNFDMKQLVGFVSENSILMLTIGEPVQQFVAKAAKVGTDSAFGWVPFGIGSALSSASSGALGYMAAVMYSDYIDELLPALRGLFIWSLDYFMFVLMFVAKFVAYWLIPFVLLYVFLVGATEKSSKFVIKIVATFIKPVIFIPIIFLTVFLMDFTHNILMMGIDVMKDDLTFSGSIFEVIGVGILVSFAKIFELLLEFIIAYQFTINGTRTVLETFEIGARDLSDVVSDGVASTFQNKIIK
jgi:hypothetical protein